MLKPQEIFVLGKEINLKNYFVVLFFRFFGVRFDFVCFFFFLFIPTEDTQMESRTFPKKKKILDRVTVINNTMMTMRLTFLRLRDDKNLDTIISLTFV